MTTWVLGSKPGAPLPDGRPDRLVCANSSIGEVPADLRNVPTTLVLSDFALAGDADLTAYRSYADNRIRDRHVSDLILLEAAPKERICRSLDDIGLSWERLHRLSQQDRQDLTLAALGRVGTGACFEALEGAAVRSEFLIHLKMGHPVSAIALSTGMFALVCALKTAAPGTPHWLVGIGVSPGGHAGAPHLRYPRLPTSPHLRTDRALCAALARHPVWAGAVRSTDAETDALLTADAAVPG